MPLYSCIEATLYDEDDKGDNEYYQGLECVDPLRVRCKRGRAWVENSGPGKRGGDCSSDIKDTVAFLIASGT